MYINQTNALMRWYLYLWSKTIYHNFI